MPQVPSPYGLKLILLDKLILVQSKVACTGVHSLLVALKRLFELFLAVPKAFSCCDLCVFAHFPELPQPPGPSISDDSRPKSCL